MRRKLFGLVVQIGVLMMVSVLVIACSHGNVKPEVQNVDSVKISAKTGRNITDLIDKIKQYLPHPNLNIYLIGMEIEEIRLLNGWSKDGKKGSERFDRYPVSVKEELHIKNIDDYI